jgi:hypothetical protein
MDRGNTWISTVVIVVLVEGKRPESVGLRICVRKHLHPRHCQQCH